MVVSGLLTDHQRFMYTPKDWQLVLIYEFDCFEDSDLTTKP